MMKVILMKRAKRQMRYLQIFLGLLIVAAAPAAFGVEKLTLNGQWQQGGIVFGKVAPGYKVKVGDRRVRATEAGEVVFGIAADAPPEFTLELIHPQGRVERFRYEVQQREYKVQHVNGVEQKHVTPPAELTARIWREAELAQAARLLDDPRADFLQDFIWPLTGPITG